jgi:hypothetical protein
MVDAATTLPAKAINLRMDHPPERRLQQLPLEHGAAVAGFAVIVGTTATPPARAKAARARAKILRMSVSRNFS